MSLAQASVARAQGHGRGDLKPHLNSVPAWTIVTGLVFGLLVYLSSGPLDDPDVWWHVRLGRQILDTHHLPHREVWSFAALGHAWTPTAWLSDVVYGGLVDLAGWRALIFLKLVVCAITAWLVLRLARRTGASPAAVTFAFTLSCLPLTFFLRERPQAFSLVILAVLASWFEDVRRGRSLPVVRFLALQWIWANVHGMWFLGPVFLVVAAICDALDSGRPALVRLQRHLVLALGGVAVAALTPVGPRLVVQPFLVRSAARQISEWQPTVLWARGLTPYLIAIAVLVLALARRRSAPTWSDPVWLLVVVAFSLVASRNVAPAAILLAAPLARAVDELGPLPADARIPVAVPAVLALLGVGFAVAGAATETAIARSEPTRLVNELGRLPAPRHVLNDYTVGGLISGTQPAASVAIDGRTDNYSPSYVDQYLGMSQLQGPWQQLLRRLRPDCALLASDDALTHVLVAEYGWRVVDHEAGYTLLERGPAGKIELSTAPGDRP
ncbi:MAG TPA: hypothetical protein VFH66_00095 [Mycobacteriales bacterium]|nr:hypothetical protein [Mycobacteriales bacterium]